MMPLLRQLAAAEPAGSAGLFGYWLGGVTVGGDVAPPESPLGNYWHANFWPAPSQEEDDHGRL